MWSNSIRAQGLRNHIEAGRAEQNGRGFREFKRFVEYGDQFGRPMTVADFMLAFNRSRHTIKKWLQAYCQERGVDYPDDLGKLLVK